MTTRRGGAPPSKTSSYSPVKTLHKAFAVIEFIGSEQPVMPAEIGRELRLTRGNVHRLLATLEDLGYIERGEEGGYRLSYKLFRLGNTVVERSNLREAAHSLLEDLSRQAGEDACLAVLHEKEVIIVERIKSPNLVTLDHDIAHAYPIHCCASGKIFLSALDDEALQRLLADLVLTPRTARTFTDRQALLQEVLKVRRQGYSQDIREYSDDIHTIAAPVFGHTNRVIATVSVSGPSPRFTEEKMEALVGAVLSTAAEISRRMGGDAERAGDGGGPPPSTRAPRKSSRPL